jgi:hypothetical protein
MNAPVVPGNPVVPTDVPHSRCHRDDRDDRMIKKAGGRFDGNCAQIRTEDCAVCPHHIF